MNLFPFHSHDVHDRDSAGFTLVEIIVAISIFVMLVTVSLGAIANIFDANRKAQSLKDIMTNLNFAVEVMAREMRFATRYHCGSSGTITQPQNCSNGESQISFLSVDGKQIVYRLNGTALERSEDGGLTWLGVTAPQITLESLSFYTFGAASGDGLQPRTIILIRGHAGVKASVQSSFSLQTTVSQRILDK